MGFVYILKNTENNLLYIGVTTGRLEKRMNCHVSEANRGKIKTPLYMAMRNIGVDKFHISKLEKVPNNKLFFAEKKWIKKLNSVFPLGYNSSYGGCGGSIQSDQTKLKKSKLMYTRYQNKTYLRKQKTILKKIHQNELIQNKRIEAIKKAWQNPDLIENARKNAKKNINLINAKGYLLSKKICSKSVELFDNKTKKIHVFESAKDACRFLNVSMATVSQSIYRKTILLQRYLAKYRNDKITFAKLINEIELKKANKFLDIAVKRQGKTPHNIKAVKLISVTTKKKYIFRTVKDAAQFLKRQTTNISYACQKEGRIVAGYYAKYCTFKE